MQRNFIPKDFSPRHYAWLSGQVKARDADVFILAGDIFDVSGSGKKEKKKEKKGL